MEEIVCNKAIDGCKVRDKHIFWTVFQGKQSITKFLTEEIVCNKVNDGCIAYDKTYNTCFSIYLYWTVQGKIVYDKILTKEIVKKNCKNFEM